MLLKVIKIDTPTLGNRSYIIHDGITAVVIDPQRDIDRINDLLINHGLTLGAIFETHMHNDYLSGGLQLSREHGVKYVISKDDSVNYQTQGVANQEVIEVGSFALKAIHTPGHTFTHMSYELMDFESKPIALFSGGSLLHGTSGRPDLLGLRHADELAGLQYDSAQLLANSLEDEVELYPTHGFGSFCAATPSLTDSSTIGDQRQSNPALLQHRDEYIEKTLGALDIFPTYFKYMGPGNLRGPSPIDLSKITDLDRSDILLAIEKGAWVVDLQNRAQWAKSHLAGSTSIGIDGSMASYLGWLYPYGKELILISDNQRDVKDAQRELARIGIDRPAGAFVGEVSSISETKSCRVANFSELAQAMKSSEIHILDVRQIKERDKSYIDSAIHIPFYEVEARVNQLPHAGDIWVHCASGYRASIVLGFIEESGRVAVLIDDDYENAKSTKGLRITSA